MKVAIFIPARQGSTRIVQKNISLLRGVTLLQWTAQYAVNNVHLADSAYLSSDTEEYWDRALGCPGRLYLEFVQRSAVASSDTAPVTLAVREWLDGLAMDETPDIIVMLQCTNPFRQRWQVDMGIRHLIAHQCDSLFFSRPFERWVWRRDEALVPLNYDPGNRPRTQDKIPEYMECGDYIFRRRAFDQSNAVLSGKIGTYPVWYPGMIDIDDIDDLTLAEAVAKEWKIGAPPGC